MSAELRLVEPAAADPPPQAPRQEPADPSSSADRRLMASLSARLRAFVIPVALLVLWWWVTASGLIRPLFVPPPRAVWQELIEVSGERVRFVTHYQFETTGDELISASELRFRPPSTLAQTLTDTGFSIEHWYGDWSGAPVDEQSRELIVIAVRD